LVNQAHTESAGVFHANTK